MFKKIKRSYAFDVNKMAKVMLNCPGSVDEGYTRPFGFWGAVIQAYGWENDARTRKGIYSVWRRNAYGIHELYLKLKSGHKNYTRSKVFNFGMLQYNHIAIASVSIACIQYLLPICANLKVTLKLSGDSKCICLETLLNHQ